ncbi:MAG: HAD-IIB family hydrolase [DPANN group archaeon]|nr:HAD-IIB family hydrolase [DPANN group archaeon]
MEYSKDTEKLVIFTDLDGTLIDHKTYSFIEVSKTLRALNRRKIPVIICASRTRAEIEQYRGKLNMSKYPFIIENGGAIFIPKDYFSFDYPFDKVMNQYNVIELGTPIAQLNKLIKQIKKDGFDILTFSETSINELSKETGLTKMDVMRAKKREYDFPFKILDPKDKAEIVKIITAAGYKTSAGGRYQHLMGPNDKGHAVKILTDLFQKKYGNSLTVKTIGFGDSENDISMLQNVNIPVLVKNREHKKPEIDFYVTYTELEGPKGWSATIEELLGEKSAEE